MPKKTESDKALKDELFEIGINSKYNGCERGLASMVYKFVDKKPKGSGIKCVSNQQLPDELHIPIITKFKNKKAYVSFKNNIWSVDLDDMQLIVK